MTLALITTNPPAVIRTLSDGTTRFQLPGGDNVEGAQVGWTGDGCALVAVASFVPPAGQQITGEPSYAIDQNGAVIETYATQDIPATPQPSQAMLAQAALDASDGVAIRCFKAGVAFPPEWQTYVAALRSIVKSNAGDMPTRPPYPAGT